MKNIILIFEVNAMRIKTGYTDELIERIIYSFRRNANEKY